jgi:hypothetical protein
MSKRLVIDLFSGTRSLQQPALDLGLDYLSVDFDPELAPDIVADISTLKASTLPFRPFMVWASPPCTHFSVASISKNWAHNPDGEPIPRTEEAAQAVKLVERTLWLIAEICPRWWFIENPRGMLRRFDMMRTRPCMNTVTYCQYGDTRQKPTDIWHNNPLWIPRQVCRRGADCHESAPRGSKTGTQGIKGAKGRGAVPYLLLREILEACIEATTEPY